MKSSITVPASLLALGIACAVQANPRAIAPVASKAVDDTAVTAIGRSITLDVLANDGAIGRVRAMFVMEPARNGSASIVDGKAVYVPAAGFTGRDSFRYYAKGATGTAIASVTVDVGQALVLSGKVTDSPIANAAVQVSVDGHAFATQADANGNYSLEVIGQGGMVMMAAQGTGAQAAASFLSVVGDFDRLQAEAGADGVLTRDENNQVQVTNVSTAQAYLLQVANGGAPVVDDAQLVASRESLDNGQLLRQAAAIKLVVDGGYALPAGVTDTLALITDPAVLEGFIAQVDAADPAALSNAIATIVNDPDVIVPTDADALLGTYTLIYHLGIAGAISTGYIQGDRVTLDAGGTGSYVGSAPNANPAVTWSFENGRAIIIPTAPVESTSYPSLPGIGQVRQVTRTTRYEIAKLFEGNGRDTLAVTSTQSFTYPDNPTLAGGERTGTGTNTGIRDLGGIIPVDAADVVGTRSLWIAGTPYRNANFTGSALFTFNAGGTGTREDGAALTWTIDALGRLLVAYANGDQAVYSLLNEDGRKGAGVAAEWRSSNGARSAAMSLTMELDGSAFTAANAEGSRRSGFYVSRGAYDPSNLDFFIVLDAGQIGQQVSYGESQAFVTPVGWGTSAGVMDATYYRNGMNQPVNFCQVGVNGCYINQVRRWRPVAADGNRVYVIEEFLWDTNADGIIEVTNQRANYYDLVARPPFVLAPAAAPVVKVPRR